MDKGDIASYICGFLFIVLISGTIIGAFVVMNNKSIAEDKTIVAEGMVEDMRIEAERGFGSQTWYFLTIEGKEVEVDEDWYYMVNMGDNVTVYKSGKVDIN